MSVASVATVASIVAVPSALNDATPLRSAPISSERPKMPLQVIIAAANTVSRASVAVSLLVAVHHQRHDQPDLDDGDGDGQDQRAERLADAVRDDLGVIDGGQHRAGQQQADDDQHRRRRLAAPGGDEGDEREQGDDARPVEDPHPYH